MTFIELFGQCRYLLVEGSDLSLDRGVRLWGLERFSRVAIGPHSLQFQIVDLTLDRIDRTEHCLARVA